MLKIVVPAWEDWDPVNQKFLYGKETKLTLEHSLLSISKWESKFKKPFLTTQKKTLYETLYYIRCMTIINPNKDISEDVYRHLTNANIKDIEAYMEDPMTATTFKRKDQGPTGKIITSEQIYFSMASYGIPFECQQWHFNRLMTLLEVAAKSGQPGNKMTQRELMAQNRALNAARKAKTGSRG